MKAITLTQPWASLVALGEKRIETRSWSTNYRGPLAIHAAATWDAEAREKPRWEPFKSVLHAHRHQWPSTLPLGMVVATCTLVDVQRIHSRGDTDYFMHRSGTPHEYDFGNFEPGRYAWLLTEVRMLREMIRAKGSLGIWEWTAPKAIEWAQI